MDYRIFPTELVIDSMKDSGYKDAAHAVAELIDNSIQAGEELSQKTEVELICIEKDQFLSERRTSHIEKIAVYDNACGMTKDILSFALAFGHGTRKNASSGMGKFGMGLPNASISQCDRVDVWSWVNNEIYHTYLDIDEIIEQKKEIVPEPVLKEFLPVEWVKRISSEIRESGTLIVWSKLERLKWKRHKAFFSNTEFIIGRMYRYFIRDNKCSIRFAAYSKDSTVLAETYVKPNDPLYLMTNSQAPFIKDINWDCSSESAFFNINPTDQELKVKYKGSESSIFIRTTKARKEIRRPLAELGKNPGDTALGKQCAKNQGISIVRSGRELELNRSFDIAYDPVERFWGMEIEFSPCLDEVFGVTNNKQAATAFKPYDRKELAEDEGLLLFEFEEYLENEDEARFILLQVSNAITSHLKAIRAELKRDTEGVKKKNQSENIDRSEQIASEYKLTDGETGYSETHSLELSEDDKRQEIIDELHFDGLDLDDELIEQIVQNWLDKEGYIITSAPIRASRVIFDVSYPAGKLKVTVNENHPAFKHFISELDEDESGKDILRLLFASWARLEDKYRLQSDKDAELFEQIRMEWGQIAEKMISKYIDS